MLWCEGEKENALTIMQKIILSILIALVSAFTIGGIAAAIEAIPAPFGKLPTNVTSGADFVTTVLGITDWIFVILLLLAIIFIVLAGFQFVTGGGDPTAVAQARNKLIYAAVGIIVALLAKGLPVALRTIITTP